MPSLAPHPDFALSNARFLTILATPKETVHSVDAASIAEAREQIRQARRIVVKVGSNVLVGGGAGVVNRRVFCALVEELAVLDDAPDRRIFLVSSGAIAIARRQLGIKKVTRDSMARKQALAAVGQPTLMKLYAQEFDLYDRTAAQVLISPENLGERERFLNARNTLRELADIENVITVINENDTTSTAEIRFGDNDNLGALVCSLVDADLMIILSDIDGLYTADPSSDPNAKHISVVWADDPALKALAAPADPTGPGSGGMGTKLRAAKVVGSTGIPTVIAPGRQLNILHSILNGDEVGTLFIPRERLHARKSWLAHASLPAGTIVVDDGAANAIVQEGGSLLAIGVRSVEGEFELGCPVDIVTTKGDTIARGVANYSSREMAVLAGQPSERIAELIGYHNGDAVVHRDDLALVDEE